MPDVAKRHHVIPQFYLRGFAQREQITTVRLPGDVRFRQSIRRAASENNFYSVDGISDRDSFEHALSGVEGEVAGIFRSIQGGNWPLSYDERLALAFFIVLQAVRGPGHRRTMAYLAAQVARLEIEANGKDRVASWVQHRYGVSVTPEQAEDIWEMASRPEGPPITVSAFDHIEHIVISIQQILPYISGRPWSLVRFDKRSLVTSDSPVGLVPPQDRESWAGVGFANAWGITYPLTRKMGLILSDPMVFDGKVEVEEVHKGRFDSVQSGTTYFEKFFNMYTVECASEWLFHHPDDGRFLPAELPDASPVSLQMLGDPVKIFSDQAAEAGSE